MKRVALLLMLLLPGCLVNDLINSLGAPTPGFADQSPAQLRAGIRDAGAIGFFFGAFSYCSEFLGLCDTVGAQMTNGALTAGLLAPGFAPVRDGKYYNGSDAATCLKAVSSRTSAAAYIYMKMNEKSVSSGGSTGVLVADVRNSLNSAAVVAPAVGAPGCFDYKE